jgi:hypothetical protein
MIAAPVQGDVDGVSKGSHLARVPLHFTPTSSSWLNLVEGWFSLLSHKSLTNPSFTSVAELETRTDCSVSHWDDNPEPIVWTKPADEIPNKVACGLAALDRITNFATHH